MATTEQFFEFFSEKLSAVGNMAYRKMMGEYVVYYRDKVIGDVCDNCFFVKKIPASVELMPSARSAPPYQGAKDMLVVEDIEDTAFLTELFEKMYAQLPAPKKKK